MQTKSYWTEVHQILHSAAGSTPLLTRLLALQSTNLFPNAGTTNEGDVANLAPKLVAITTSLQRSEKEGPLMDGQLPTYAENLMKIGLVDPEIILSQRCIIKLEIRSVERGICPIATLALHLTLYSLTGSRFDP